MPVYDVRVTTRWFTTRSHSTWHVATVGDRALCRANIRPYSETYSDAQRIAYPLPIPRCIPCVTRLAAREASRSMAYDCPCCSETVMGDGTRALCADCQTADCEPNRDGAYDDCQRACQTCGDPRTADFYVCVVYERSDGETSYSDGYICADHLVSEEDAPGTLIPSDATVLEYTATEIAR